MSMGTHNEELEVVAVRVKSFKEKINCLVSSCITIAVGINCCANTYRSL